MTKLPTLSDLHFDNEVAIKNDQLKVLLNQKPPASWVKKHPFAKNMGKPIEYITIEQTETLLDRIFQEWRVEVISFTQLFQSIAVQVRLHYKNPIDGTWQFQDGLGAVGVQTDKGASASDLGAIKSDAIMKALPAAKSYAVKDACHHLGTLFGRNMNRADKFDFTPAYNVQDKTEATIARVKDWLKAGKMTFSQLVEFKESETFKIVEHDKEIIDLVIKLEQTL